MRLSSSWGCLLQVVYQVELTELSYQQNSQFDGKSVVSFHEILQTTSLKSEQVL